MRVGVWPPQVVEAFAGSAITSPTGKLSVKFNDPKADTFAVLSMVNVRVLLDPKFTVLGEKLLENPGRVDTTFKSSVAVPLLPSLEVKSSETFVCVPTMLLVTSTLTMQFCELATLPPLKLIEVSASGALTIPSVHVVDALAGLAITTPFGRGSVKAKSSTGEGLKLAMVNVSVETLPGPIVSGTNVLVKFGPA